MRQVPQYLILGDGRAAHHFQHYFSLLHLPFQSWNRRQPLEALAAKITEATHILLLVSDDAIDTLSQYILTISKAVTLVHFSGSLSSQFAYGAHPLMTFNEGLYDMSCYQTLAFIIDDDAPDFNHLLPGLKNPYARLKTAFKAKYHALCVLSGNFSCLLWQKLFSEMEQHFKLPAALAKPYLIQQLNNVINHYPSAFTGPLARNDQATIKRNLQALENDPFQNVYQSFLDCYQLLQRSL